MSSDQIRESKALRVRCGPDGRVMLDELEASVTVASMRDWMRARFAHADPFIRLDDDQMEASHELFVDLWLRSGPNPKLRESMDQATAELLPAAWAAGAEDWVEGLLRFVETVTPPSAQPFLSRLVQAPQFEPALQACQLDLRWLNAAASYTSQGPLVYAWKALLWQQQQRYAQIAYFALRQDIELGVETLPALFDALSADTRPLLVRQALKWLFEQNPAQTWTFLNAYWDDYGKVCGLRETVEKALSDLGRLPIQKATQAFSAAPPGSGHSRPRVFKPNDVEKARLPIYAFSALIPTT